MKDDKPFDVLIIGAGVSGTALLYMLTKYTNAQNIMLVEKYAAPAQVNSLSTHNSQTLHCGDIETNYDLKKALGVKRSACMLRNYATAQPDAHHIIFKYPKMVLGVGEDEVRLLRKRYEEFKPHYPNLKLLEQVDIINQEPKVAYTFEDELENRIREDGIVALGSTDEYTAVNFETLSQSFVRQAKIEAEKSGKQIDVFYNESVEEIVRGESGFIIYTGESMFVTETVVACAGGHSLQLAHNMGYGLDYSVLPVAGSYYFTPWSLYGKVYTVQNDALPFAAVHGDPDVRVPGATRFGPTALVLPMLERYNWETVSDFFEVFKFDRNVAKMFWKMLRNKDMRNYMLKNILYEIPFIRKFAFLKEIQKIIPSMKYGDLKFAKGYGGLRPQLIDKKNQELVMGEAKIDTGDGIIFNMTPSPGGTACVENAEIDMRTIAKRLGLTIDEESLQKELLQGDCKHGTEDFVGLVIK